MAQDLRLAVSRGPVSLPIYVAEAQGYFEREGVAVRTHECSSGRSCFQLLAIGQTDLATAAELLVALDSFTGSDVAIIATLNSSAHSIKLVARRGAGIKVPEDLRGKRIATVAGTSAQYFLDRWLVFHEIDPKQVDVVPLAPEQLVGALQRHEADAIAIWEPIASTAMAALAPDGLLLTSPRVYIQHFSLIASRQAIAQREADLIKLLRALQRAERLIAKYPLQVNAKAKAIMQARANLDRAFVDSIFPSFNYRLSLEQSLVNSMEGVARWSLREGHVAPGRRIPNYRDFVEPGPLRTAVPRAFPT